MAPTNVHQYQDSRALEDAFIKVTFEEETGDGKENGGSLYKDWTENASAKRSDMEIFGADMLRRLYPNHSLIMTNDYNVQVLAYPGCYVMPLDAKQLVSNIRFVPFARNNGTGVPGALINDVRFGAFKVIWDRYEFIVYLTRWETGFTSKWDTFILHDGPGGDLPAKAMIMAVGSWFIELHEEIWVFNSGYWQKSRDLWVEVQKADWKDVILKEDFKDSFRRDIYSFFSSEHLYKQLSLPWKRGIIMYGPPGNGKTISIKALMKDLDSKGQVPLYIKSLQSWKGEEGAMTDIFQHARLNSPCVIIFEDLDSLINDRNRSFFLNEIDGLEGNDGLLIIGTTNHIENLDPALSSRPSRFDRKYNFDDPDKDERTLYVKYWQIKLSRNEDIEFPDSLVVEIAETTSGFSFAYLKEAFVSSLVLLLQSEEEESFADIIRRQIKTLRKELNKSPSALKTLEIPTAKSVALPPRHEKWEIAKNMAITAAVSLGRSFV